MSDTFGVGTMVASAIDTAGGIYNNERNIALAKENLAWQKYVQNQTWNREDNAVQRRMKDLKAAGMNPLLAAGGAASSGQAVTTTAPHSDFKTNFTETVLALAKAQNDISMTRTQQQLVNQQIEAQRKQNELTQLQIDWYKNHPGYAPGVDSTKTVSGGLLDLSYRVGGRIGSVIGNAIGHATSQRANVTFESAYDFYKSQGMSHFQAIGAATRAIERGKQQRR